MATPLNLKELEQKAFTSYHNDGLIDIAIGIGMAGFGILITSDFAAIGGILGVMMFSVWAAAKKYITVPRLGYADFGTSRKRSMAKAFTLTMVLGIAVFVLFSVFNVMPSNIADLLRRYYMAFFGLVWAGLLLFFAYVANLNRLALYAAATAIAFTTGSFLQLEPPVYIVPLGLLVAFNGLVVLMRFIRENPIADEEQLDV
jgi:protein-S-isoprenylcysteine O-methyltransferase Ste14